MSDPEFTDGPLCQPADALRAWLEDTAGQRVRLPVKVTASPLGISRGTAGDGPGALELRLDSGALSRTLAQHVQEHCGDTRPCVVWMEGTWGPLVGGPSGGAPTFAVRRVIGPVAADDTQRARVG